MDYMMTQCVNSDKNKSTNNKKSPENKNANSQKLNNTIKKIKHTSNSRKVDKYKKYLPESPNIVRELKPLDYPDSVIEIFEIDKNILIPRFQELTANNLESTETSALVARRYNITEHKIETTNTEEYELIKEFLNNETFPELTKEVENINQSSIGKIIMEGYRRYLQKNMYLTFNFHHVFKQCHQNKGTWFYLDDIHQNLMVCFNNNPEQYEENIDDRYIYQGCLEIYLTKSKNELRIPLYLDKNGQLGFPSMRKIENFYFTIFNISDKKELYIDYDIQKQEVYLISDDYKELIRYLCTHKGISMYEEYPEYLNKDYVENITQSESKYL